MRCAIAFAIKAHQGIPRKGTNLPYIVHPLEALAIVSTITDDPELAQCHRCLSGVCCSDGSGILTLQQI